MVVSPNYLPRDKPNSPFYLYPHEQEFLVKIAEQHLSRLSLEPDEPKPVLHFGFEGVNIDLNPPLYPTYEQRIKWDLDSYIAYMADVPKHQKKSLDPRVVASRQSFYEDYFIVASRK